MAKTDLWSAARTTRRQFLGISGALLALYAGRQGLDIGREMVKQEMAWLAADDDNLTFLRKHDHLFRNLRLGASFAPEQWKVAEGGDQEAFRGFLWMLDEAGLGDIRLGLRWQRIESNRGRIDLSQYHPLLSEAFRRRLPLCLNIGPIRTFRWPEEHLPPWVSASIELPGNGAVVGESTALASAATDYLARLLDSLSGEFGAPTLAGIPMVQVENEPFYRFRSHRWTLESSYVRARIRQVQPWFPRSELLVGTAGRINFGPVKDLFLELMTESPDYRGRLVMGFDYHYKTPLRDSFPIIRYTDPITFSRVGYRTCEENREQARELGYRVEVTEAQAEPNGGLTDPGNSARHFRFMLLRCAESVLDTDRPSLIRVWGIEELAKKAMAGTLTSEHAQIIELMRRLNSQG